MADENLQTDRFLTAKIKVYYDLLLPAPDNAEQSSEKIEPPKSAAPHPLLIALHGYGGNKRAMMREVRELAPANFAVASVQGFHQHWRETATASADKMPKVGFAWLTDYKSEDSVAVHHQILSSLIANLTNQGIAALNQIYLLGFSQSCALNFRFAFANPELLRGVVGIGGGIPGDWETSEVYQNFKAPIFYLYGTRDEFYPLEKFERNAERLKLRARNLQTKAYDAAHEITDEMRRDVRSWLERTVSGESGGLEFWL